MEIAHAIGKLCGWENNPMCFLPSVLERKYNCFVILKQSMRGKKMKFPDEYFRGLN